MNERNFTVSAPQLFCLLLFYLLSGMMLFSGGSFFPALLSVLFSCGLCVIASAVCKKYGSSQEFFAVFGVFARPLRLSVAFLSALPLAGTLAAFSRDIYAFYGDGAPLRFALPLALFCIFALLGGFHRAARFAELCIFALAGALLLALFGGGNGVRFAFSANELFTWLDILGAPAAVFSLYLRCATRRNGKMSDFALGGTFHPSPLAAGVCASLAALALWSYFCFAGENILFSLLSCFFALSRLLLFSLTVADLLCYPEKREGAKCALTACAFCAFHIMLASLFPDVFAKAQVLAALVPCALFILSVFIWSDHAPTSCSSDYCSTR